MIVCKEKESDKNECYSDAYLSIKENSSKTVINLGSNRHCARKTYKIWKRRWKSAISENLFIFFLVFGE